VAPLEEWYMYVGRDGFWFQASCRANPRTISMRARLGFKWPVVSLGCKTQLKSHPMINCLGSAWNKYDSSALKILLCLSSSLFRTVHVHLLVVFLYIQLRLHVRMAMLLCSWDVIRVSLGLPFHVWMYQCWDGFHNHEISEPPYSSLPERRVCWDRVDVSKHPHPRLCSYSIDIECGKFYYIHPAWEGESGM